MNRQNTILHATSPDMFKNISKYVVKGRLYPRNHKKPNKSNIVYSNSRGELVCDDAVKWLKSLKSETADCIFADPPYNMKKAEWDIFESQLEYVNWSIEWISEAARVLKTNGTMYVFGIPEILADIKLPSLKFFHGCRWIVWNYKNKANLGKDWGRSHEGILHFRKSRKFTLNIDKIRIPYGSHTLKYPEHPQARTSHFAKKIKYNKKWMPHPDGAKPRDVIEIPTICNGMFEKTPHPTQKPEELFRKLVCASTNSGDLIIDPFMGSGTSAVTAEQLDRYWKGCDNNLKYLTWAIKRIEGIDDKSSEEWMQADIKNTYKRRNVRLK